MSRHTKNSSKASAAHKRKLFVEAYVQNGGNATDAAIKAGYAKKSAHAQGCRLLKHAEVQGLLKERQKGLATKFSLKSEDVIHSIAAAIYFDVRKLFHPDGRPRAPHEIDDETALAIEGVEIDKDGRIKYKSAAKNAARDQACKHLGLYEKDNEQPANAIAKLLAEIAGGGGVLDQAKNRSE